MKKLAIISSHPIQYNAPLFRLLAESKTVHLRVFYTWEQSGKGAKYDPGFGKTIEWDIPLLEGYESEFVTNTSYDPGTHHFKGMINPGLNKVIEAWQPDLLLVYGWSWASHLKAIRHFHGRIPVLFRGDSTLLNEKPGLRKILRRIFLTWVYRHVDYALYVGTNNKDYFLRHGLKPRQLIHAPHAVDNRRFSASDAERRAEANDWKRSLGIKPGELVVLFAGKLEAYKDPAFVVGLAERWKDLPVRVILVGNGQMEEELKQRAKTTPGIIFLDFQNQTRMPVVYRLADLFILSSHSQTLGQGMSTQTETWGLGANEAMACGCGLMLCTGVGGAVDLVKEGLNGIIFPVGGTEKCTKFVQELLAEPGKLEKIKAASRQRVEEEFSFEKIVRSIEELCNRIS
ncbi:MAG TPA: glycosyltransferase family 4 protein [Puia sp.]|jgi:glycosyltransferase involved in cell wall biosynthesis